MNPGILASQGDQLQKGLFNLYGSILIIGQSQ